MVVVIKRLCVVVVVATLTVVVVVGTAAANQHNEIVHSDATG